MMIADAVTQPVEQQHPALHGGHHMHADHPGLRGGLVEPGQMLEILGLGIDGEKLIVCLAQHIHGEGMPGDQLMGQQFLQRIARPHAFPGFQRQRLNPRHLGQPVEGLVAKEDGWDIDCRGAFHRRNIIRRLGFRPGNWFVGPQKSYRHINLQKMHKGAGARPPIKMADTLQRRFFHIRSVF